MTAFYVTDGETYAVEFDLREAAWEFAIENIPTNVICAPSGLDPEGPEINKYDKWTVDKDGKIEFFKGERSVG